VPAGAGWAGAVGAGMGRWVWVRWGFDVP